MQMERYPASMRWLHWCVGALVIFMLVLGLVMETLPPDMRRQAFSLHKSLGVTVFLLVLVRLLNRWRSTLPPLPDAISKFDALAARTVHHLFYLLLLLMPVSGAVMSQAKGYPVAVFGFHLPVFIDENKNIGRIAYEAHELIGYILIGIIALHIGGTAKHLLVDRINILRRMV